MAQTTTDQPSTSDSSRSPARRSAVLLAVVLATATFGVGAAVRAATCSDRCGDIASLYVSRGIRPDAPPYLDRDLEYPVVVGAAFYAATALADSPLGFFAVNVVMLGALTVVVTVLLARRATSRVRWWALAPPLALYGVQNWDLLAIAPAVGGLLAYENGAVGIAGVLLAIGASAKLYPGLFLAVLVVDRLAVRDRRGAARLGLAAVATLLVLNLPVLVASPHGWLFAFEFQSRRLATWASLWHYVFVVPGVRPWLGYPLRGTIVDVGALLALALGTLFVLHRVWRRALAPIPAAAVMTAVFVLANKVYSPQYDLWLVPFFVLVATPRARILWFFATDVAVFVVSRLLLAHSLPRTTFWMWLLLVVVIARAAVIVVVARGWLRSGPAPESGDVALPKRALAALTLAS